MPNRDIKWRLAFKDKELLLKRKYQMVYLSENPDGTLDGTEKMTRREYATAQKFLRMAMGMSSQGLRFSESQEAVAHRGRVGILKMEKQFGKWVVWEAEGERPESGNNRKKK